MKKNYSKKIVLSFFALSMSGISTSCFGPQYPGTKFVIFHTNDTHSRVVSGEDELGFGKIASIIEKERNDNEYHTLFFDAGDTFHGKTFANLNQGKSVAEIYSALKLDAMSPGNHDFNFGYKNLLNLQKLSNFPMLAANVVDNINDNIFTDNFIIEKDGVNFGIFGLSTPETAYKTHPKNVQGLKFLDPIATAKKQVKLLKEKQVDVIIAIGHIGNDEETKVKSRDIAENVSGINLFIDGHSHEATSEKVNDTLIVQSGEHTNNLGKVELFYDKKTKKINFTPKLLKFSEYKNEKNTSYIQTIVDKYQKVNKVITSEVVANTKFDLDGSREIVRTRENRLGNLIASAIKYKANSDFALMNGGGIRETIKKGDITRGDIIEVLPFNNIVYKVEITGKKLIEAINHGIKVYPETNGAFPNVAGMKIVFDSDNKVISAIDEKGNSIQENKTYTLAINDFLYAGGDEYKMFMGLKKVSEYGTIDETLIEYMNFQNWKLSAQISGRIKLKK